MDQDMRPKPPQPADRGQPPCWRELVKAALDGAYPGDWTLEAILDRIEKPR